LTTGAVPSVVGAAVAGAAAVRSPLPPGSITRIVVIDLENENATATFSSGAGSNYLSGVLEPLGTLVSDYYAIGHVSLDNYIAQVSGQAPNLLTNSDCVSSNGPGYVDMSPGTPDADHATFPGQVDGQGCVMPAIVQTIGGQLDAAYPKTTGSNWREYAQDMGNDPSRDHGVTDPLGGTDCAHPDLVSGTAVDPTMVAEGPNGTGTHLTSVADQYVDRHNPFIYFHSVIDRAATCNRDVVPLGTVAVGSGGSPDTFTGHLVKDLAKASSTPRFAFITPNVCSDGHDASCAGTNTDGTTTGGLVAANAWLAHWMPLILHSPAYRSGHMLVVITSDESDIGDSTAGGNEAPGPNNANPGYSPLVEGGAAVPPTGTQPGGGRVGALLLNPLWVRAGAVDTTGSYNHYSALRTYEDLLGITKGGADGRGHLGFASSAHDFGPDVFRSSPARHPVQLAG